MEHGERSHALYSASGAKRWTHCHASVRAALAAPKRPSSPYAMDGTEAHELLDFALSQRISDAYEAFAMYDFNWTFRADTFPERIASVQMALDEIYAILAAHPDAILYNEMKLTFVNTSAADAGGHVDVAIYVPSLDLLYVIDFKHGAGVAIDLYREDGGYDEQLLMYAVMTADNLLMDLRVNVVLVVIQPRAFHKLGPIREAGLPPDYLIGASAYFDTHIELCEADHVDYVPGEWCRWCDAATTTCQAIEAVTASSLAVNFRTVQDVRAAALETPANLSIDRLSYILQMMPIAKIFFKQVEQHARQLLMHGYYFDDWKIVEAQRKREYDLQNYTEVDIASSLMRLTGKTLDGVYPRQLIPITEADKLVSKHFRDSAPAGKKRHAATEGKDKLAELTVKDTSGTYKLVRMSDRRPAVHPAKIMFRSVDIEDIEEVDDDNDNDA